MQEVTCVPPVSCPEYDVKLLGMLSHHTTDFCSIGHSPPKYCYCTSFQILQLNDINVRHLVKKCPYKNCSNVKKTFWTPKFELNSSHIIVTHYNMYGVNLTINSNNKISFEALPGKYV